MVIGFPGQYLLWPFPAHGGGPHPAGSVWLLWSPDPLVIAGILLLVLLYVRGWRAIARRAGRPSPAQKRRAWLFAAGALALVIAMLSPVDGLAEDLFSAHMVQHTLLILVAAPLLVLGYPLPALLLGLPAGLRRAAGAAWRRSGGLRWLWRAASQPLVAWLAQAGLLWLWHAPAWYQAAVENEAIHALEHFSFLAPALLFWWVTIHDLGGQQEQRGLSILYLFTAALQGGLLGALLTFSPQVWYPIYGARAAAWGLSALADQQLAGTIMWVPAGLVYLAAALMMMKRWLDGMEAGSNGGEDRREGKIVRNEVAGEPGRKVDHESYEPR